MSLRHVIKREQVLADQGARPAGAPASRPRPARGVRLIQLEPGRYAIEHVCRCGDVSVIEVETADAPTSQENPS